MLPGVLTGAKSFAVNGKAVAVITLHELQHSFPELHIAADPFKRHSVLSGSILQKLGSLVDHILRQFHLIHPVKHRAHRQTVIADTVLLRQSV